MLIKAGRFNLQIEIWWERKLQLCLYVFVIIAKNVCIPTALILFFLSFVVLGPHPQHMDIPWPGVEPESCAPGLCQSHSQLGIRATSAIYITAHGHARSRTQWARPGMTPGPHGWVHYHWATMWTLILNDTETRGVMKDRTTSPTWRASWRRLSSYLWAWRGDSKALC